MKASFRQNMAEVHTWSGLLLGWVLFFMFLTGTAGYFDTEIDRWMQPELPRAQHVPTDRAVEAGVARLEFRAPGADRWFINMTVEHRNPYLRVSWQKAGRFGYERLDPINGGPMEELRATGGGGTLYTMHYRLRYLPESITEWVIGVATMFMLIAITTGVIVHRKIFTDFFTFRPRKGQRSWLDAHNILAVVALPFHLMITYSGFIFYAATFMPLVVAAHYGLSDGREQIFADELSGHAEFTTKPSGIAAPLTSLVPLVVQAETRWGRDRLQSLTILHPGDAKASVEIHQRQSGPLFSTETLIFDGVTGELVEERPAARSVPESVHNFILGLHEGVFAGVVLRWLYFVSGLFGTAMIATGLVLWTVKRRQKFESNVRDSHPGLDLVERLNVGTVIGLPIAIAAYFWANRLIPVSFVDRAAWEVHTIFIVWATLLLHAALRPVARAWTEQAWIAAAAFAFLPVLNALTTDRHLGLSLPQGDWIMAGFDLTMLAFGLTFACVAWALARRIRPQSLGEPVFPAGATRRGEPAE